MNFRFGRFELDEDTRELRLGSRVMALQPRVFDLLVYLLRNRERVVSKDELLTALWPEVVVTDSSIMRAVSVIRATLREGGQEDTIRTYSRQGYRFVGIIEDSIIPSNSDSAARAREAVERGEWHKAFEAYRTHAGPLEARDYEQWGHSALCIGQPNAAIYPLERSVAAHSLNNDRVDAARAALTLANLNIEDRALAVAKGWLGRATALLSDETHENKEHGLLLWLTARIALFENNLDCALANAKRAEALARRVKDPDVEALGLVYRAHIELATGKIRDGLLHMDEAGAATLGGTVSPWVCGYIFCSVIWAYLDRGDLIRAGQWTDQLSRWCQRNASFGYNGLCRLHRGEVLCAQGDLPAAESEIRRARELLAESARYAEGDACRVLGEILLLRGDKTGAEQAFRQAHELGWHPLPGWALLQAENGDFAAAIKSLQRGLQSPTWIEAQRRGFLLGHLACIAAQAGKITLARRALTELTAAKNLRDTVACLALFHRARGEVALAGKKFAEAADALRESLAVWLQADSKIHTAHTRLRLAECLARAGEPDEAELELTSAEKAFQKMDAVPMAVRCQALRKKFPLRQ